jgi:hypothetical protein
MLERLDRVAVLRESMRRVIRAPLLRCLAACWPPLFSDAVLEAGGSVSANAREYSVRRAMPWALLARRET